MRWLVPVLTLFLAGCPEPDTPRQTRELKPDTTVETVELHIGEARLGAEVVRTPEKRTQGLMFRQSLAPDSGMLFVFDSSEIRFFWMRNTWIPLDIAYIDSAGGITDILQMAVEDTMTPYGSSRPVPYALETNQGWFQSHGIRPGDTVRGIPR